MFKKTRLYRRPWLYIFLATPLLCYAAEIDIFSDPDILNELAHTEYALTRSPSMSDQEIAELLIDLGAATILQQNLYLHTDPLNERNIVDFPLFLPQEWYCEDWTLGTQFFWNQLDRARFTRDSTSLCSYLAIQNPELLAALQETLNLVDADLLAGVGFNPLDVLPLFANITVQQRRMGMMMHTERQIGCGAFRIMAPLYYNERNFFLTPAEQDAIEAVFGVASADDTEMFAKDLLISDRFGLGDTRITIDKQYIDRETFFLWLGLQATVPTAFTIASGLLGSEFKQGCRPTSFSFQQFFELAQGTRAQKKEGVVLATQFLMGAIKNLSAILLQPDLGNGGHLGLGGYLQTQTDLHDFIKLPWSTNFVIKTRISLEYLLPAYETRSYIQSCKTAAFDALGLNRSKQVIEANINDDPAYASEVLAFLETQFIDEFYPFAFRTRVFPGVVFRSTSKVFYQGCHWGFHLGSDFWLQGKEKLRNIKICPIPDHPPFTIDSARATKPLAYQSKAHGSLFYQVRRDCLDWILGLGFDGTVWGTSIGDDFTVSLNIETNF